jgi:hypothetical protein
VEMRLVTLLVTHVHEAIRRRAGQTATSPRGR